MVPLLIFDPLRGGDELVTYDLPGMVELLEYYSSDDYLIDND